MINKLLIANRGEIAVRIIRACMELGIKTVAVFSQADASALHTHMADEAVCIGPAASRASYLNVSNILSAAVLTGADAIHPGYGFLAENATFAEICAQCNIRFVGPQPASIRLMGDKAQARSTMQAAGVPVVPGSDGPVQSVAAAKKLAKGIGFPLLVKAAAGGGGRGIRRVDSMDMLEDAFTTASAEAKACFNDDSLYLERFIQKARHVEIQVLSDGQGNVIHLGERDCSMQRRNQKMIEESPCIALSEDLRERMGKSAVDAARAVDYENAGTVEFLLTDEGEYYFMEMNTRIQVEHPVTEMVSGIDLIQAQLRVADGQPLKIGQSDILLQGHAIECRIIAEDPDKGFRPSCGTVSMLCVPGGPGVRFDSFLYQNYAISPHYDSMLGKLIVHAPSRRQAIRRMQRALGEMVIEGVQTNIDFLLDIIESPEFIAGNVDTGFLTRYLDEVR